MTVFPRSRVVCTVINKSDLNIAWANLCNSLHHIISISRRVLSNKRCACILGTPLAVKGLSFVPYVLEVCQIKLDVGSSPLRL